MGEKVRAFDKRIHELDFLRGSLMVLVVMDHLFWFINFYIFKSENPFLTWYWTNPIRTYVREAVLCLFFATCGVSCYLSRNNFKRGAMLTGLALAVTIFTRLAQNLPFFNDRVIIIDINILGSIGLSILLFSACRHLKKSNLWLIVLALTIFYGFILYYKNMDNSLIYNPFKSILYLPFNPIKARYVGDYLPTFPYVIFLFIGYIGGSYFLSKKKQYFKRHNFERPICFLGRHSLLVYIGHEVILTLIFMGIGALI